MCGRFTAMFTWAELHRFYDEFVKGLAGDAQAELDKQVPRYNIAPTQPVLVFRRQGSTSVPHLMRWGLVPGWVEDPRDFPLIINARSETMADKASFRNSLKNQRCIVPASGYYEWRKTADGKKTPYYITNADGSPMLFAGLFSTWSGPDGEEIDTTAIVTLAAKGEMKQLHDRTPAILNDQEAVDWIDTANVNSATAHKLVAQLKIPATTYHPVSTRVNSPRNDDEGLIVPVYEDKPEVEPEPAPEPPKKGQLDLF